MQKHMDDEHYKTGQDHVCRICTLAFPNPPALFQHMHRNHVRAEVIFVSVSLIYWIVDRILWFDEKINFRREYFFLVKLQRFFTQRQSYIYQVLQTIQMKLILLCVWAELAVLGSAKTALKFIYTANIYSF